MRMDESWILLDREDLGVEWREGGVDKGDKLLREHLLINWPRRENS